MNTLIASSSSKTPHRLRTSRRGTCKDAETLWFELIRRHEPGLKRRLRGTLGRFGMGSSEDLVEDLTQEVYRRLVKKHGHTLDDGPARCELTLAAYLGRTADSTVVDRLRYQRAAKRFLHRDHSLSLPWVEAQVLRFPDPASDPEQRAIERQQLSRLLRRLRDAQPTETRNPERLG